MIFSIICCVSFPVLLVNVCELETHPISSFVRCALIHFMKTLGKLINTPFLFNTRLEVNSFTEVLRIFWNQHANFFNSCFMVLS